jgi:hypothetical protein
LCAFQPDNEPIAAQNLHVVAVNEALGSPASFAHVSGSNPMKWNAQRRQA